jgi:hypothetical protein
MTSSLFISNIKDSQNSKSQNKHAIGIVYAFDDLNKFAFQENNLPVQEIFIDLK